MNTEKIKSLFRLFSGDVCDEEHEPIIESAILEVEGMISETADRDDSRLDFLCAALANFRYYQILSAQDRSEFTYGGKILNDCDGKILAFAEGLLKGYFHLCGDMIKGSDFVFIGTA